MPGGDQAAPVAAGGVWASAPPARKAPIVSVATAATMPVRPRP
jgi:hypothetical protein